MSRIRQHVRGPRRLTTTAGVAVTTATLLTTALWRRWCCRRRLPDRVRRCADAPSPVQRHRRSIRVLFALDPRATSPAPVTCRNLMRDRPYGGRGRHPFASFLTRRQEAEVPDCDLPR
ncbi:hypothetical protein GQF42_15350 [Streptomyces broussonetiae]|uniref:Uncharacterized protein n=1 Tax=Streptomyces broussonetiae TaxID=2686304 RepID=A0A6I6N7S6_9ACTN|nr:hypothetical protein GQF42_15350 [Streptomyces broussonetiae]